MPRPPAKTSLNLAARIDRRQPVAGQIYFVLRRAIVMQHLAPRRLLSENELAEEFGVSRTPVRQAVLKLADDGLVDILPQVGTVVTPIRLNEVAEAQFIRDAMETAVVAQAARAGDPLVLARLAPLTAALRHAARAKDHESFLELDEEFHHVFSASIGQVRSWRLIQGVKHQLDRVRFLSLPEPGRAAAILREHEAIAHAVINHDAAGAARHMNGHLAASYRTVQGLLKAHPEMFEAGIATPPALMPAAQPVAPVRQHKLAA